MFDVLLDKLVERQRSLRNVYQRQLDRDPQEYIKKQFGRVYEKSMTLPIVQRLHQFLSNFGMNPEKTAELAAVAYPILSTKLLNLVYSTETGCFSLLNDGKVRHAIIPSTEGDDLDILTPDGSLIARISFETGELGVIMIQHTQGVFQINQSDDTIFVYLNKPVNAEEVLRAA